MMSFLGAGCGGAAAGGGVLSTGGAGSLLAVVCAESEVAGGFSLEAESSDSLDLWDFFGDEDLDRSVGGTGEAFAIFSLDADGVDEGGAAAALPTCRLL